MSPAKAAERRTLLPGWFPFCRGSQESIPRWGKAVDCSKEGDGLLDHLNPVQEMCGQIQHTGSHFQALKQQQQQLAGSRRSLKQKQQQLAGSQGSKNFKSLF